MVFLPWDQALEKRLNRRHNNQQEILILSVFGFYPVVQMIMHLELLLIIKNNYSQTKTVLPLYLDDTLWTGLLSITQHTKTVQKHLHHQGHSLQLLSGSTTPLFSVWVNQSNKCKDFWFYKQKAPRLQIWYTVTDVIWLLITYNWKNDNKHVYLILFFIFILLDFYFSLYLLTFLVLFCFSG